MGETKIRGAAIVALMLAVATAPAYAADTTGTPDAKLSISAGSVGVGIGGTKGSGTLTYKGHQIPVKYTAGTFGEIGVTSIELSGDVNNLEFLESFDGCYKSAKLDSTLGVGSEQITMTNEAGVQLALQSKTTGLALSLSKSCNQMKMDPDALARALAALSEPPVPAKYHASVYFDTDSDKVASTENNTLDGVIELLKKQPGTEVIITGYADTTGSEAHNKDLSERRAAAVLDNLKKKAGDTVAKDAAIVQMRPKRVDVVARGEVAGPQDKSERKDRRVDILVIAPGEPMGRARMGTQPTK